MKKLLLLLLGVSSLCACATIDQQVVADVLPTETQVATATADGTPDGVIGVLDKLKNNRLFTLGIADSQRTLARVDTWKGQISDVDDFAARQCPNATLLIVGDMQNKIETAKGLVLSFKNVMGGATDGEFTGFIEPLTVAKWGPKGTPGADPRKTIGELRDGILNDVATWRRACSNLINDALFRDLMEQAAGIMLK